jgi:hypothetical protein
VGVARTPLAAAVLDLQAGCLKAVGSASLAFALPAGPREYEVLAACASARRAPEEIPGAARLTAQAWQVVTSTSSPRIMRYVTQLRRDLAPCGDVDAVRELDDLIFGTGRNSL